LYVLNTNRTLKKNNQELAYKNQEITEALIKGQTIERKRVAMDLHDNLGTTLSALWLSVDAIDKSKMNAEEKTIHQNLRENLEKAYNDVRLLSHNLLPEEFEKQGLVPTLKGLVRKINKASTIVFDLTVSDGFDRVSNKIEFELYSICLELVNNILKHSKATQAKIELIQTEKHIKLVVSDNGIGTIETNGEGQGMKNVRARVESLHGSWEIMPLENQGVKHEILVRL
jgi:signal transduction histidine kinase